MVEAVWKRNSKNVGGKPNQYSEAIVSDSGTSRLLPNSSGI